MQTVLRISLRNVFRQKKRSFLLAGAIAFGMLMITLANSFTGGLAVSVRDNVTNALGGHVFISGEQLTDTGQIIRGIDDDESLERFLADHDDVVESITKRSQSFGSVIFGSRQGAQIIQGVDFSAEDRIEQGLAVASGDLARTVQERRALVLPKPLAERLGVVVGENVLVRLDTVTGQQNVGEFLVTALIEEPFQIGISVAYSHIEYLNDLLNLPPGGYQSLNLSLRDMNEIDAVAQAFAEGFVPEESGSETNDSRRGPPFMTGMQNREAVEPWEGTRWSVTTLNDVMEPVEQVLQVIDAVGIGIFLILLLIIMVGITNTFRMILLERMKEIGTMRAFGMQRRSLQTIFLTEAALLALLGAAAGILAAFSAMAAISAVAIDIPGLQFFLNEGRFVFAVQPLFVAFNLMLLLTISLAAAFWPARAAARLSPAEALGREF